MSTIESISIARHDAHERAFRHERPAPADGQFSAADGHRAHRDRASAASLELALDSRFIAPDFCAAIDEGRAQGVGRQRRLLMGYSHTYTQYTSQVYLSSLP